MSPSNISCLLRTLGYSSLLYSQYTKLLTSDSSCLISRLSLTQPCSNVLHTFSYTPRNTMEKSGLDIKRTTQHAMYTTHFLQGETSYSVGTILKCWCLSSDGRVHNGLADNVSLYSTTSVIHQLNLLVLH